MCSLDRAHHLLVARAVGEAHEGPGSRAARGATDTPSRPARDLLGVAREDLGGAGAVVEADERLRDDQPRLSGNPCPSVGSGTVGSSAAMWS